MSTTPITQRVPPGPEGNLTVQEIQRDPLGFLTGLMQRYGDVVHYDAEAWSVIFVNRPAFVRHVLQENHPNYVKQGTPDLMMLTPMLGDGLLTSDGENWLWQRRLAQPAFHRERIETFARLMTDMTTQMVDRWDPIVGAGGSFEATEEMTRLTTRIVAHALFGIDVQDAVGSFGQAVQAMNEYMGNFDPIDRARYGRFAIAHRTIGSIVSGIIDQRRHSGQEGDDFLGMLLAMRDAETGQGMSDRQLRDQVMTLLMAGHETTAKVLTWTFHLLDRHPDVRDRLEATVDAALGGRIATSADLKQLDYVWMVLQEAMRLYPPVWIISRIAVADDTIGGYHVPAGTLVLVSPYALHRHPALWPDPERFDPERFAAERVPLREPFAFFPFSGGPRQCIGKSFATVELQLVLATIVQRYRLHVLPGHPVEPEALVTLRPRHGLPVSLEPRRRVIP